MSNTPTPRSASPDPARALVLSLVLALSVVGCEPTRASVKSMLEDRGYHEVEIDPIDNELGVFHFHAKRTFEDCRGTFVSGQKLLSVTCSERSAASVPSRAAP
jgi:hypothetical protein